MRMTCIRCVRTHGTRLALGREGEAWEGRAREAVFRLDIFEPPAGPRVARAHAHAHATPYTYALMHAWIGVDGLGAWAVAACAAADPALYLSRVLRGGLSRASSPAHV